MLLLCMLVYQQAATTSCPCCSTPRQTPPTPLWHRAELTPCTPASTLMQPLSLLLAPRLQIEMTYDSPSGTGQNYRRKYRVRALAEDGKGAAELKFKETVNGDEKETTVMQYYKDHYGLNLDPR